MSLQAHCCCCFHPADDLVVAAAAAAAATAELAGAPFRQALMREAAEQVSAARTADAGAVQVSDRAKEHKQQQQQQQQQQQRVLSVSGLRELLG